MAADATSHSCCPHLLESGRTSVPMALTKSISDFLSKVLLVLICGWNVLLSLPKSTQKLFSLYMKADSLKGNLSNPVYIPPDILAIILSHLPVKSIMRCKAVSRAWRYTIQSKYFVSLQLSKTIHQPPHFLHMKTSLDKLILVDSEGLQIGEIPIMQHWYYTIMGSYNGLICLAGLAERRAIYVWNPMTGYYICLPMSSDTDFPQLRYADIGFDSYSKKYKVVRVYIDVDEFDNTRFEIITLGDTSWRPLCPFYILEMGTGTSMYFNGFVYWVIATNNGTACTWNSVRILSLDLADEKFQLAYLPYNKKYPLFTHINWNLINLGGVLYLSALDQQRVRLNEKDGYQLMHTWQLLRNDDKALEIRYQQTHKLYTYENLSYTLLLAMGNDESFLFKATTYESQRALKFVKYFIKSEERFVLGQPGGSYLYEIGSFKPSLLSPGLALLGVQSDAKMML